MACARRLIRPAAYPASEPISAGHIRRNLAQVTLRDCATGNGRARPSSRHQHRFGSVRHVELKVSTRTQGDHTVMSVTGEIDLYTAPGLQSDLMTALGDGNVRLIVDMSGVDFCDSTGMNVLLCAHRHAIDHGGELMLAGPGSTTRKVLQVTGLESVFTVIDSPVQVTGS